MRLPSKKRDRSVQEVRSVEQFMEDQIAYENRKYENLKNRIIKEEEEEQHLYQPSLCKKSRKLVQNSMKYARPGSAMDKAGFKKKETIDYYQSVRNQEEKTYFRPSINKVSKDLKRGINPLIQDADRRHQARLSIDKIVKEKVALEASRAFINSKSDKVLYNRFCQDFKASCDENELGDEDEGAKVTCV